MYVLVDQPLFVGNIFIPSSYLLKVVVFRSNLLVYKIVLVFPLATQ